MLEVSHLDLALDHTPDDALRACATRLGVPSSKIRSCRLVQRAVDARARPVRLTCVYAVEMDGEAAILRRAIDHVRVAPELTYQPPSLSSGGPRPVIVGAGPCGLFCTLILARAGKRPILLERGKEAGARARDVTGFWRGARDFDPESNVQFGEGGAGTFSDGKLYTRIRDREGRIPWILRELHAAGAPEQILINNRPHIGTDRLITVVRHMRNEIRERGGEIRFETKVVDVRIEKARMTAVQTSQDDWIESRSFVFAVGHSARDTVEMLHRRGVPIEAKPFSLGVRIEHPQRLIDRARYGPDAGNPLLGAAAYQFATHAPGGRGVYSFCMCPGGLVVAAASEPNTVVTNGMSSFARAESNANSGFMTELRPEDIPGNGPLRGIAFQRLWEKAAFTLGGGSYRAPAQLLGDFLQGKASVGPGDVTPSYRPGVVWTDLRECLPELVADHLRESVRPIEKKLRGFYTEDAVMTGVETRSSSPVRIPRDESTLECLGVAGFHPAGEGSGYAGGIVSAAVDGVRVAEKLLG